MRRFLLTSLLALGLITPAGAVTLLNTPVTVAAGPLVTQAFQLRAGPGVGHSNIAIQGVFTYGSGGTTALAWVQTSFDGGATWADVCALNFATASSKVIFNISSATPIAAAAVVPTDGTRAGPNTCADGLFGSMWRVKYTTAGTYAGGTVLRIDAIAIGLTVQ